MNANACEDYAFHLHFVIIWRISNKIIFFFFSSSSNIVEKKDNVAINQIATMCRQTMLRSSKLFLLVYMTA